jgi:hypothetical protein
MAKRELQAETDQEEGDGDDRGRVDDVRLDQVLAKPGGRRR